MDKPDSEEIKYDIIHFRNLPAVVIMYLLANIATVD